MARYSVWNIDAWENDEETWDYNAKNKIADIELSSPYEDCLTKEEIINALYEREIITTNDPDEFDTEDYGCYPHPSVAITNYCTGEPLFEINFEEE